MTDPAAAASAASAPPATRVAGIDDLAAWGDALLRPSALIELAVLAACVGVALGIVQAVRSRVERPGTVWFGTRGFDGVLFPVLALLLALAARHALDGRIPIVVLHVAVPVLTSLAVIRTGVRVLRVAFPGSTLVRSFEATLSWLVWGIFVLWLTGLLPLVLQALDDIHWKVGGSDVSLRNLLEGGLSAVAVMLLMLWIAAAIEAQLLKDGVGNLSVRKIAANASRALLLLIGLLLAMSAAGIPLAALSVLGGAVGVGLGFGLQKLAANYVSGFVILAERSLRIGDLVKVDGFEGRITDINTRYTRIRALGGRESIVPNELMITQRVESLSTGVPRLSLGTRVQVAYGTDLQALLPELAAAVAAVPRVLADPAPAVQLAAFAADGLDLNIGFWIADPENGQGNVISDVNLVVLAHLERKGIEIPYPQRVMRQL